MKSGRVIMVAFTALFILSDLPISGQAASPPPAGAKTTLEDLRALAKTIREETDQQKTKAAYERIDFRQLPAPQMLRVFLEEESDIDTSSYSEAILSGLKRTYERLIKELGRTGDQEGAPTLVKCLTSHNSALRQSWSAVGEALVGMSDRIELKDGLLDSVVKHDDPKMAKMGAKLLDLMRYRNITEDVQRLVDNHAHREQTYAKWDASGQNWERVQMMRNMDAGGGSEVENLVRLIKDSVVRQQKYLKLQGEQVLDHDEVMYLAERERNLTFKAVEKLAAIEGAKAFEALVSLLEAGRGVGHLVPYHLYKRTGKHFPVTGYLSYGNLRCNVDLSTKAAAAASDWYKKHGARAVTKDSPAALSKRERLAKFRWQEREKSDGEFARPVDEVIGELLTADDRDILAMLANVLRAKALSNAQIGKLIEAAKTDTSADRRAVILQVINSSTSEAAAVFLSESMNAKSPEGQVLKFLQGDSLVRMERLALLKTLYKDHPSKAVKEAVLALAVSRDSYRDDRDNSARDPLIRWIVEESPDYDHRVEALRAAYNRAGVNSFGGKLVEEALDGKHPAAFRKSVYEMLMQSRPDKWIGRMANESDEGVRLAGVAAYKRKTVSEDEGRYAFWDEKGHRALKHMAENDSSPKVKAAAADLLSVIRKKAYSNYVSRKREELSRMENIIPMLKKQGKAEKRAALRMLDTPDRDLEKLKDLYGDVPADVKKQLDAITEVWKELLEKSDDDEGGKQRKGEKDEVPDPYAAKRAAEDKLEDHQHWHETKSEEGKKASRNTMLTYMREKLKRLEKEEGKESEGYKALQGHIERMEKNQ